jgi:protein-L-isoaspartate O-methyltransferase
MSIQDLEFIANSMSANSVSMGDWETLVHYAKELDTVVELGTNIGSTSIVLSYCAKQVHTIDVFERLDLIEDATQWEMYKNHWQSNKHTYEGIMKKLYYYPNIMVYQNLSHKAAEGFMDETVDMVFIDADHSYEGVKKDFEAWFPKIKHGGKIAFHDVGPGCPVFDFYNNELTKDNRIVELPPVAITQTWTVVFTKV